MGIQVGDNFDHKSKKPLDARTSYATLALMKAVVDANINEGCLAYCAETDKYYKFLSTNSVDADTGKWREFSSGGGGGTSDYPDLTNKPSIEGVTLSGNKTAADLGLAKSSQIPSTSDCYKTGDTAFTAIADGDYVPMYDTSDTAKKKSTWSNIKSVLKTYFDTLYNKVTNGTGLNLSNGTMSIKQFESGDMDEVISELPQGNTLVSIANAFNKGDIYSTSEKMIGQWVNGKPLYQKTINFGTLPNATSKTVNHGISNLENIVDIKAWCSAGTGTAVHSVIPYVFENDASKDIRIQIQGGTILICSTSDKSSLTTCYVTLQYTKSTDSSVSIGEETEYSTSEKIVGSWIDSKPIYQKTITFSSDVLVSNATWYAYSISGLKDLVYIRGGRRANATTTVSTCTTPLDAYYANGTLNIKSVRTDATNATINYITIQYTKA